MRKTNALLAGLALVAVLGACSKQSDAPVATPPAAAAPTATAAPASAAPAPAPAPPRVVDPYAARAEQGENWEYVVNNALRTAGDYAVKRNPDAVFLRPTCNSIDFIKQAAGEHKDRYVLHVVCESGGNTDMARLLPLFDENAPSDNLDDSGKLWKVLMVKHNGRQY